MTLRSTATTLCHSSTDNGAGDLRSTLSFHIGAWVCQFHNGKLDVRTSLQALTHMDNACGWHLLVSP